MATTVLRLLAGVNCLLLATQVEASSGSKIFVADTAVAEILKQDPAFSSIAPQGLFAQALTDLGGFEAVTTQDIKAVLDKSALDQTMGCQDLVCATDLARIAKTDLLLRSELGRLGNKIVLAAALIHLGEARVLNRASLHFYAPEQLGEAVTALTQKVFGKKTSQLGLVAQRPVLPDGAAVPAEEKVAGKVVVVVQKAPETLLAETGRAALEKRLAGQVAKLSGLEVIATQEVLDLLQSEENKQLLGSDSSADLSKIAGQLDAKYLVSTSIGQVGSTIVVAASLLDAPKAATISRQSLLLSSREQLAETAECVVLGLFGDERALPIPTAHPNRFQKSMTQLAQNIAGFYAPYQDNALSRIAVLPFSDNSSEAMERKLGDETASFVRAQLVQTQNIPAVEPQKINELKKVRDLSRVADMDSKQLLEIGRFLGASVLVVGSVSDVSNDFMVSAQLVDMASGKSVGAASTFFPMGDRGTLYKKAFVVRSTAGAVYRAVVPGWGQFYNGPEHYWKGGLVLAGFLVGAASAGALFTVAGVILDTAKKEWNPGGDLYAEECTKVSVKRCKELQVADQQQAVPFFIGGGGAVAVAVGFWVFGFIDAALSAEDYTDEIYGAE